MPTHTVVQGECLSNLAARFGLSGWEQIYTHPANAGLRKKRPNPNVLAPDDEVMIPVPAEKTSSIVTGRTHTFQVNVQKIKLRIAIVSRSGKPYGSKRFQVTAGTREIKGSTNAKGLLEADLPAIEATARLRVWLDDEKDTQPTIDRDLSLGNIDPIDMISGLQGRLSNMGYSCAITGEVDERLLAAAVAFRAAQGLPKVEKDPDDDDSVSSYSERLLDDAFRSKLTAIYETSAN